MPFYRVNKVVSISCCFLRSSRSRDIYSEKRRVDSPSFHFREVDLSSFVIDAEIAEAIHLRRSVAVGVENNHILFFLFLLYSVAYYTGVLDILNLECRIVVEAEVRSARDGKLDLLAGGL